MCRRTKHGDAIAKDPTPRRCSETRQYFASDGMRKICDDLQDNPTVNHLWRCPAEAKIEKEVNYRWFYNVGTLTATNSPNIFLWQDRLHLQTTKQRMPFVCWSFTGIATIFSKIHCSLSLYILGPEFERWRTTNCVSSSLRRWGLAAHLK